MAIKVPPTQKKYYGYLISDEILGKNSKRLTKFLLLHWIRTCETFYIKINQNSFQMVILKCTSEYQRKQILANQKKK